jgi:hypothetical protein
VQQLHPDDGAFKENDDVPGVFRGEIIFSIDFHVPASQTKLLATCKNSGSGSESTGQLFMHHAVLIIEIITIGKKKNLILPGIYRNPGIPDSATPLT